MVDSRESWQNVHCDLWKSQAHTEILRPCRGAIIEAAVLKSGLLGERDMCKAFLLLGKSAVTYYANLQGNEWIQLSLKNALDLQMLPSCQHKLRLAPQEEWAHP